MPPPKTRSTIEPTTRMSVSRNTTGGVLARPAAAQSEERLLRVFCFLFFLIFLVRKKILSLSSSSFALSLSNFIPTHLSR